MDSAVTIAEFDTVMRRVLPALPSSIAVACSGGPDSMALTCLLQSWAADHGIALTALIVDHGLRSDSADEASRVASWLTEYGVEPVVLTSDRPKPTANIQMHARDMRYRLITGWCKSAGVTSIALAHHQDDQAETFLLRLARGSGVDGLAAMQPVSIRDGVALLRPLLSAPKSRLSATLENAGWSSVADPSNENEDFARVRMRALMPVFAREGMDAGRLARTAGHMAEAAMVLDDAMRTVMDEAVTVSPHGFVTIGTRALLAARPDTATRLLSHLLSRVGGSDYPPRLDRLQRLLKVLLDGTFGSGRTAAGCRLICTERSDGESGNALLICRETAAIVSQKALRGQQVWDGRFTVKLSGDVSNAILAPLGLEGWRDVVTLSPEYRRSPPGPSPVRRGLPGLWVDGCLAAAPSLGIVDPHVTAPIVEACALAPRLNALAGSFHWQD